MFTDAELDGMRSTVEDTFTQTCTVLTFTAGAEDDYGNATETWVEGATYDCLLSQRRSVEFTDDRNVQLREWVVRLPHDAVVDGKDRLEVDGTTYEIVGPPESPPFATHLTVPVEHVEGA